MATQGVSTWSRTPLTNATADPNLNWAEGMAPSAVNDQARGLMAEVAGWRDDIYGVNSNLTTSGTSVAYTCSTNQTYADTTALSGAIFSIVPHATNGAGATLAVDGLAAKAIVADDGSTAIPIGALVQSTPALMQYSKALDKILVRTPAKKPVTGLDINGASSTAGAVASTDKVAVYNAASTVNYGPTVGTFLAYVNTLVEDTSPDGANDYLLSYDSSAAGAKKVKPQSLPVVMPRGYIDGCKIANGTDSTNDIDVSSGICRDETNAVNINVATMAGKQLDANWAAGASAGIRDTAAGITNGTYHIYAIATATGTQDVYATTHSTAASVITAIQLESGGGSYAYCRRIASILRESGSIIQFTQTGDYFRRNATAADVASTNPGSTAQTATLSLPINFRNEADIRFTVVNTAAGNNTYGYVSDLSASDETATSSTSDVSDAAIVAGGVQNATSPVRVFTNTSAQVRYRLSRSDANITARIRTIGWTDQRGKNG